MNFKSIVKLLKNEKENKKFIITFYLIGFIGIVLPITRFFFIKLTPFAIILNIILLLLHHAGKINGRTISIFFIVFLAGYVIEVIGVKTGMVFGDYIYGNNLGFKVLDTPLIIGLNWLLLSYLSTSIFEKLKTNNFLKVCLSSTLMLVYDIILEPVAPKLDYWYWANNVVDIKNYIAWFIISFLFNYSFKVCRINTVNPLSKTIFFSQLFFFIFLNLFL